MKKIMTRMSQESMRKFLIEKMMDKYDPPSYEETEEQTSALPYKTQRNSLFPIKQ